MRLYAAEFSQEVPSPSVVRVPYIFAIGLGLLYIWKQGFTWFSHGNVEAEEGATCPQFAKEPMVKHPGDTGISRMLISTTSHSLCFPPRSP